MAPPKVQQAGEARVGEERGVLAGVTEEHGVPAAAEPAEVGLEASTCVTTACDALTGGHRMAAAPEVQTVAEVAVASQVALVAFVVRAEDLANVQCGSNRYMCSPSWPWRHTLAAAQAPCTSSVDRLYHKRYAVAATGSPLSRETP